LFSHVSVLAGCGAAKHCDGAGEEAAFHAPNGLAIDSEGTLYVADSGTNIQMHIDSIDVYTYIHIYIYIYIYIYI